MNCSPSSSSNIQFKTRKLNTKVYCQPAKLLLMSGGELLELQLLKTQLLDIFWPFIFVSTSFFELSQFEQLNISPFTVNLQNSF